MCLQMMLKNSKKIKIRRKNMCRKIKCKIKQNQLLSQEYQNKGQNKIESHKSEKIFYKFSTL